MANERLLTKMVALWFRQNYADTPFRIDIAADMPLPRGLRGRLRELHGERWTRGHPDMIIYASTKKYSGLFVELKDTEKVPNTEHTRRQRKYHEELRKNGYKAEFACGFDETKKIISKYMRKVKNGKKKKI